MKKLLVILIIMCSIPSFAFIQDVRKNGEFEMMVNKVGFNLLNSNKIPYRVVFKVNEKKKINAASYYRDKHIEVHKGLIPYLDSEDELAAILAHEISHSVDYNQGVLKGYFSYISTSFNSKKYETKADKRGVDYMVKAGYNPVAMIIVLNKIVPQERYEWYASHPLGSKRLANIYEEIYTKYPEYLVQNEYKDNIIYQNFLLTSKENRQKFEQKVKANSKKKVNYL